MSCHIYMAPRLNTFRSIWLVLFFFDNCLQIITFHVTFFLFFMMYRVYIWCAFAFSYSLSDNFTGNYFLTLTYRAGMTSSGVWCVFYKDFIFSATLLIYYLWKSLNRPIWEMPVTKEFPCQTPEGVVNYVSMNFSTIADCVQYT